MRALLQFCRVLACHLNWVAYLPAYWCDWTPTGDGSALIWNGAEKFYRSEQWLSFIDIFLCPRTFTDNLVAEGFSRPQVLNGRVAATGQDG